MRAGGLERGAGGLKEGASGLRCVPWARKEVLEGRDAWFGLEKGC